MKQKDFLSDSLHHTGRNIFIFSGQPQKTKNNEVFPFPGKPPVDLLSLILQTKIRSEDYMQSKTCRLIFVISVNVKQVRKLTEIIIYCK